MQKYRTVNLNSRIKRNVRMSLMLISIQNYTCLWNRPIAFVFFPKAEVA